jgi:hypothetical protein
VKRWATALAGWAARVRGGRMGRTKDSAQKLNSNKKKISFLKLFYKLKINLNSNQI